MDAIKVTTNHDGRVQCHHREASKHLSNKPLKRDKEGRGNQLRSRKWSCQQMRQVCREGVVRITMISPRENSYCHSSVNHHDTSNKLNHEAGGPLNGVPRHIGPVYALDLP